MAEKTGYVADFPSEIIKEGKIQVLVPNLKAYGVIPSDYAPSKAPVFYNPVMEFNRDLTVLAFRAYQKMVDHEVSICEPLTSQGIRGIRYAVEVDAVTRVVASDINHHAYELAQHNIELNKLQDKITLKYCDANRVLSSNASPKKRFDIVDLDPFGTPVPYLDSAFRALKNKGLIAATATDLAPLCGVHAKACLRKYGGKPIRTEYCHEVAVRLSPAVWQKWQRNMTSESRSYSATAATTTSASTPKSVTAQKKRMKTSNPLVICCTALVACTENSSINHSAA